MIKKLLCLIFAVSLVLTCTSCRKSEGGAPSGINNLGTNLGLVCETPNQIYVTTSAQKDSVLYVMDKDTQVFEKVPDIHPYCMNYDRGWLYYIDLEQTTICRMHTKSHETQMLVEELTISDSDTYPPFLQVYKGKVYYQSGESLYQANLDGTDPKPLLEKMQTFFFIYDGLAYFNEIEGETARFCFASLDGKQKETIQPVGAMSACVLNDKLYFCSKDEAIFLNVANTGSTEFEQLEEDVAQVNGDGEKLYCFGLTWPNGSNRLLEKPGLFSMNHDGTGRQVISNLSGVLLSNTNKFLFFYETDAKGQLRQMLYYDKETGIVNEVAEENDGPAYLYNKKRPQTGPFL